MPVGEMSCGMKMFTTKQPLPSIISIRSSVCWVQLQLCNLICAAGHTMVMYNPNRSRSEPSHRLLTTFRACIIHVQLLTIRKRRCTVALQYSTKERTTACGIFALTGSYKLWLTWLWNCSNRIPFHPFESTKYQLPTFENHEILPCLHRHLRRPLLPGIWCQCSALYDLLSSFINLITELMNMSSRPWATCTFLLICCHEPTLTQCFFAYHCNLRT